MKKRLFNILLFMGVMLPSLPIYVVLFGDVPFKQYIYMLAYWMLLTYSLEIYNKFKR